MINPIGVIQGRLSPPQNGLIQCFPGATWRDEFPKAKRLGLDLIEWVLSVHEWEQNPLMTASGVADIRQVTAETGVQVLSVCTDYFRDRPFFRSTPDEKIERLKTLRLLIAQCAKAGLQYIEIPFCETSAIHTTEELSDVARSLLSCAPLARDAGVTLCLELAIPPDQSVQLIEQVNHPAVRINYDMGDSASHGFKVTEELKAFGRYIATVHIKDRKRGGTTVPLGTGDVDFNTTFTELSGLKYQGPLILQAARQGPEQEAIKNYLNFMQPYFAQMDKERTLSW